MEKNRDVTIRQLREEREREQREIARMEARRAEMLSKPVKNEARRQRFIRRLDGEIAAAQRLLDMAEANLLGMGEPINDDMEVD